MPTRVPQDIGLAVRDHRRRLNLGQAELARRARVSRSWLISLEKGSPGAELGLVLRTLDAVGLALTIQPAAPTPITDGIDDILSNLESPPP